MWPLLQSGAGLAMALAAWLLPRRIARAQTRWRPMLVDAAPMAAGAALLVLATGRPLFAGLVLLALGAGFALADQTMRDTLREPVVFSEAVELPQVFTHPHLYLPFAGPGLVIGGAALAVAAAVGLLFLEPAVTVPRPGTALLCLAVLALTIAALARRPGLELAAAALRRLRPSGEPFTDASALGPFAMLLVHWVLARAERPGRRAALAMPAALHPAEPARPLILVQCESFFDARRMAPALLRDFLPAYDEACRSAAMFGRIEVPAWGANTMRAEFGVLSGIPDEALGYDRFNPYYAFARQPVPSQVWRLRQAGYRTICLHPFDGRFFRRDLAMPGLGFGRFLDRATLGGSRVPPYCSDPELAEHILQVLDAEGPRTLIFAITMGNHGPWLEAGPPIAPELNDLVDGLELPAGGLRRYLDGLRRSDMMLRALMDGLRERRSRAVLAFYGDHLPSLGGAFAHFGFDEPHSDYVVWPGDDLPPRRRDLPAHDLARIILDELLAEPAAALRPAMLPVDPR
ncbi:MAG: LTA synthase family protein [Alphaproteobacteria bacterium]|nr:LTA synthase family protein [Alphaproteobacteria bacterium]